jgi:YegS/Rv2252/BmrU family lipid kinase
VQVHLYIVAGSLTVILNPKSGMDRNGTPESAVSEALRAGGIEAEIVSLQDGVDVQQVVRECLGRRCAAVIAAGGDGTVSAVGAALTGTDVPLGVLPTGTLNHFARDLGLPLDLKAAVEVIAGGQATSIDVAEVNGRVFLNNSSIGFYPTVVAERERLMSRGVRKRLALIRASLIAFARFPNLAVRVAADERSLTTRTPFVFVGNNEYEFSGFQAGTRARLSSGQLQLCLLADLKRRALLHIGLLALLGRAHTTPSLVTACAREVRVDTFRHRVRVALDGELVPMRSPLIYSIRPAALRVFIAQRQG